MIHLKFSAIDNLDVSIFHLPLTVRRYNPRRAQYGDRSGGQRWLAGDLVANKRGTLWVSRVVEDCSDTTAAPEQTDDSFDDPERRKNSEDESRDVNEAYERTGVSNNQGKVHLSTHGSNVDGPRYPTSSK